MMILRGLPFNVTEADVKTFIEEAGASKMLALVERPISLLSNPQGRPSGFAEVQLDKCANYWEVHEKLNMQRLGGRYIEVLTSRGGKTSSNGWGTPSSSRHSGDRGKRRDPWRRGAFGEKSGSATF